MKTNRGAHRPPPRRRLVRIGTSVVVAGAATITALVTFSGAYAVANTLYVSAATGCSDAGIGTQAVPYCTINKAATVATAGQTVLVAGGTYSEKVTVANSGVAGQPIVFKPETSSTVTLTGAADGFFVSGKSYITIQGFTITGTTSYGIYLNNASNITVDSNKVSQSGHPVQLQTASGIELASTSNSLVTGNTSDNNSDHGINLFGTSTGNTISYNEASGNAEGWQRNANGILVTGPGNTVVGNVVHDNEDSGIQVYPTGDNTLVVSNVSYNNGDHGIDNMGVANGRIIGNTVYHNCTTGINVEGASSGYTVENNIAVDNAVYPAYAGIACARHAGNIGIWDTAFTGVTVDNNLVYLSKAGTMYGFAGVPYTSLAAMKTATGQEARGIQADPKFTAAGTGGFSLLPNSPAIDAANSGVSGEPSTDITGASRVDDPSVADTGIGSRTFDDIGAYEFIPPVILPSGTYTPAGPVRVLDTRSTTPVAAGATLNLTVTGSNGVPASGVTAVVLNVTVTSPTKSGFLTVFPNGQTQPTVSNLNFTAGETIPNLVIVPVTNGKISFFNGSAGTIQILADLAGYYSSNGGSKYAPAGPVRVLDTRSTTPVAAGATLNLTVTGSNGVPASGVTAVVLNVTVTSPTKSGFLTVFPNGQTQPTVSNLNFTAGETIPNLVIVPVTNGKISFFNGSAGTIQILADLAGYYSSNATATYTPAGPVRVLDTRSTTPVAAGATLNLTVTGSNGVPASGVTAVVLNVTVTSPTKSGFLTVFPNGQTQPTVSNLNFTAGETIPNLVIVPVTNGKISFFNGSAGTIQILADLAGYYKG